MPENRPGRGIHVKNESGGVILHGKPVKAKNYVGVAVKQKAVGWDQGLSAQAQIQQEEEFFLMTKGLVLVDAVTNAAKGDAIFIDGSNALTKTESTNARFGRVYNVAGERGVPTGKMRVDLDAKDSF